MAQSPFRSEAVPALVEFREPVFDDRHRPSFRVEGDGRSSGGKGPAAGGPGVWTGEGNAPGGQALAKLSEFAKQWVCDSERRRE